MRSKAYLGRLHLIVLALVGISLCTTHVLGIGLNSMLFQSLVYILYSSGVILFFWNLKPFKATALYFSLYFFNLLFPFIAYQIGGILMAFLLSLAIYPIYPIEAVKQVGEVTVYEEFSGPLAGCCKYRVTKSVAWILEERIGDYFAFEFEVILDEDGDISILRPNYDSNGVEQDTLYTIQNP